MLFHLLFPLADQFGPFNLFRYLTFRSGGAMVTALLISFLFGPRVIAWLKSKQLEGQPIRVDGPEGHLVRKKGTPTMGGVLILLALIVSTLLWADLGDGYVWVTLLVTVGFGGVGFFDDYKKLTRRSSSGLSSRGKLAAQVAMSAAGCFALIAYLSGNANFANYLQIHFVPGAGELAVFCAALIGSGLGFLWYNAPPAMVFMGDTGSLSLGGAIGVISVITKHELVLAIIGGLFVLETVSVIVQVASFKLTGKRVF